MTAPTTEVDGPGPDAQPQGTQGPLENKGSIGAQMLHGVLGALGGTQDVTYSRDPQTGAMVQSSIPSGPGMQFKRIIAGAVAGLAASAGAGVGPGRQGRAIALGAGAGMQRAQAQTQQKKDEANQDYDEQQKAIVRKAQTALLNQQLTAATFQNSRNAVNAQFEDAGRENEFVKAISAGGSGSKDLGVIAKPTDGGDYMHAMLDAHQNDPTLLKQQAQGNIIGVPHWGADGQMDGMHYAVVTPEWKAAKSDKDQTFYKLTPSTDPNQPPTVKPYTVAAGTMTNGDFWNAQMSSEKEVQSFYQNDFNQKEEDKRSAAANAAKLQGDRISAGAEIGKAKIAAGLMDGGMKDDTPVEEQAQAIAHDNAAVSQLNKRSSQYSAVLARANAIHQQEYGTPLNEQMNEANFKAKNKLVSDYTDGDAAKSIQSYDQFLGHALTASNLVNSARQTNEPWLNTPLNKIKMGSGAASSPALKAYQVALEPVRQEMTSFLNGNHAATKAEQESAQTIVSDSATPAQQQSALAQLAHTGAIRLSSMNYTYARTMKQNAPGLLSTTGAAALQHFGVDPASVYKSQVQQQPAPGAATATPQTHVFNSAAWAQANPGKDVNAAKALAQQKGYTVQ